MRSIKEIFEMKDKGLLICRFPGCRGYGNVITRRYGVVCDHHWEVTAELDKVKAHEAVAR
jgi:hypothetical protein